MKYFVIGAGIWGSVIAERIASKLNEPVLVIEKRGHIGGNCYSRVDEETGIECHCYGSHIFHTSLPKVEKYLSSFCNLTGYRHKVLTMHNESVYPMPINLETINKFYAMTLSPAEADDFIRDEISKYYIDKPGNLEEKAISLIGRPLYEAFIKNYTRKQWNRNPKDLPPEIITRLPFRTNYDFSYFNDTCQGVPKEGYHELFKNLLSHPNISVELNRDFRIVKDLLPEDAVIFYTGMPDELFDYKYGQLEWRSLRFEWETLPLKDFQGTTVMNYADIEPAYTRIHEFKHYHPERSLPFNSQKTVICKEYPANYARGADAYYPINDKENQERYEKYAAEAKKNPQIILGGRLGAYKYWDMDKAIDSALDFFDKIFL